MKLIFAEIILLLTVCTLACANEPTLQGFKLRVKGRASVVVTTPQIKLADIAEINADNEILDDAVIGLQKIYIADSPAPGKASVIQAFSVVDKLKASGVDLSKVGYSFPSKIEVVRAGREVNIEELTNALTQYLTGARRDISIRQIKNPDKIWIAPGETSFKVLGVRDANLSKLAFTVQPIVNAQAQDPVTVEALVDEWAEFPIATRPLRRGEIIQSQDLVKARLNLAQLPKDTVRSEEQLVGFETKREISFGEVFRLDNLSLPPIVETGSKVTMLFKGGMFEVSGVATALESGIKGQSIRVRNNSSKKIVVGTIIEPGLVEVKP